MCIESTGYVYRVHGLCVLSVSVSVLFLSLSLSLCYSRTDHLCTCPCVLYCLYVMHVCMCAWDIPSVDYLCGVYLCTGYGYDPWTQDKLSMGYVMYVESTGYA